MNIQQMYTPSQVAEILQMNKVTIYDLIDKGEISAKRIGKQYRIPKSSISYAFSGLDYDIEQATNEDKKTIETTTKAIKSVRNGQ